MAYKFQLGDFAASGSILMEGKGTANDDLIAKRDFYVTGSQYLPQGQGIYLDNDKDTSIGASGDDTLELKTGGALAASFANAAIAIGDGGAHALSFDSEGGASSFKLKDNDATALEIKESTNSYLKFVTTNSSEAVVVGQTMTSSAGASFTQLAVDELRFDGRNIGTNDDTDLLQFTNDGQLNVAGTLSASVDVQAHHSKARQMTIAYDGSGGAEGHLKLGAGGDMQLAVFTDNAFIINNTQDKDIAFQINDGGVNATVAHVDGADSTFDIDVHNGSSKGLALGGTLVTSTAAELNVLDGIPNTLTATELGYVDGVTSAIQTQIDGKAPVAGVGTIVTVGTLDAGAISSGFGNIDNGDSNITSGGLLKIDKDLTNAPATGGSSVLVAGQAGSLTLGVGAEAAIGVKSDDLYIEQNIDQKKISFRTRVGSDMAEPLYIDGNGLALADDKGVVFGSDDDVSIKYDETTSDTLLVTQNVDNAALAITYAADAHEAAGDAWAMHIAADGGKKMWMNDIASKGTMVEHFSITPNATVANSTAAFAGHVTVGHDLSVTGDLTVSGDFVQVDVANLRVEDPLFELARGQGTSADALDIGFFGRYGVGGTAKFAGLFRDQNDSGKFHLFKDTEENLTDVTTIDRSASGYAKATLVVGSLEAETIAGTVAKTVVRKNDTEINNSGNGYQLASGDTLILTAALGGNRTVFLPANPAEGDSVEVKMLTTSAGRVLHIEKGADGQNVDGGDSIILESDYAAVTLIATTAGGSCAWRVF